MLPSYLRFRIQHFVAYGLVLIFIALLLGSAVLRNVPDDEAVAQMIAVAAICGGIAFLTFRDAIGECVYCLGAPKFYLRPDEKARIAAIRSSRLGKLLLLCARPGVSACLGATLYPLLLFVADHYQTDARRLHILLIVGVLFPLLHAGLMFLVHPVLLSCLRQDDGIVEVPASLAQVRSRRHYLLQDTAITIVITVALLWTVNHRREFDLHKGFGSADFLGASLVLAWIVTFFVLSGARRSRQFAATGEAMAGLVRDWDSESASDRPPSALPKDRTLLGALKPYFLVSCVDIAAVCGLAAIGAGPDSFRVLLGVVLLPVFALYVSSRRATIARDYALAKTYLGTRVA